MTTTAPTMSRAAMVRAALDAIGDHASRQEIRDYAKQHFGDGLAEYSNSAIDTAKSAHLANKRVAGGANTNGHGKPTAFTLEPGKVHQIALTSLQPAKYNPKRRVDPKGLRPLVASLEKLGLLYPVLITSGMEVIDGHRRIAAAKVLGWKEIDALVKDVSRDAVYSAVNETQKRFSGNDLIGIFLTDPDAVSERTRKKLDAAVQHAGRSTLLKLYQNGHSIWGYYGLAQAARLVGDESGAMIRKILGWTVGKMSPAQLGGAIDQGLTAPVLLECIEKDKPLAVKWVSPE